jgi:hypothetical protein
MNWEVIDKFVEIKSNWLTLIGEKVIDDHKKLLDYWRVEKEDSVIIIVIQNNSFILPKPTYRHGLGKVTLDFAGGRLNLKENTDQVILNILARELDIKQSDLIETKPINHQPWAINSSFSNQNLLGFVTKINPHTTLKSCCKYPINNSGIEDLLNDLICLQCRSLLLEWLRLNYHSNNL